MQKLILIALFVCVATMSGQNEYKIKVDFAHSGPFQEPSPPSEFSHESTADGYRFLGPNRLTFDWTAPKIKPHVSVAATTTDNQRFRYEIIVTNDKTAKEPIRSVTVSWRPLQVQPPPEFSGQSGPTGWDNTANLFTGLLPPGKTATFVFLSTLRPEQAMLLISGLDQDERSRQNVSLVGQGATIGFFTYIDKIIGSGDYAVYEVTDLLPK